jgi:hypothetical protein
MRIYTYNTHINKLYQWVFEIISSKINKKIELIILVYYSFSVSIKDFKKYKLRLLFR